MSGRLFIMNEHVNESISLGIFNSRRTGNGFNKIVRTGNGFNKIVRTGNGFNKVIVHILPSKQKWEILFEATIKCIWLKLDVYNLCVRLQNNHEPSGKIRLNILPKRTALSPISYIEGMTDL